MLIWTWLHLRKGSSEYQQRMDIFTMRVKKAELLNSQPGLWKIGPSKLWMRRYWVEWYWIDALIYMDHHELPQQVVCWTCLVLCLCHETCNFEFGASKLQAVVGKLEPPHLQTTLHRFGCILWDLRFGCMKNLTGLMLSLILCVRLYKCLPRGHLITPWWGVGTAQGLERHGTPRRIPWQPQARERVELVSLVRGRMGVHPHKQTWFFPGFSTLFLVLRFACLETWPGAIINRIIGNMSYTIYTW